MPVPGSLKRTFVDEREVARLLEDKFGLSQDMTRAYIRLVEQGAMSAADLASTLGTPMEEAENLLGRMVVKGLVIHSSGSPQKFQALHPRMTLTNIFKVYEEDLVKSLRDRRAIVDRVVNLLTPVFEEREKN